ncbi:MAG: hypothetical protein ACKVVT_13390 [Dehalococcoidia bacterium]
MERGPASRRRDGDVWLRRLSPEVQELAHSLPGWQRADPALLAALRFLVAGDQNAVAHLLEPAVARSGIGRVFPFAEPLDLAAQLQILGETTYALAGDRLVVATGRGVDGKSLRDLRSRLARIVSAVDVITGDAWRIASPAWVHVEVVDGFSGAQTLGVNTALSAAWLGRDDVLAHEYVHQVQMGPDGHPASRFSATWFSEGSAELIAMTVAATPLAEHPPRPLEVDPEADSLRQLHTGDYAELTAQGAVTLDAIRRTMGDSAFWAAMERLYTAPSVSSGHACLEALVGEAGSARDALTMLLAGRFSGFRAP